MSTKTFIPILGKRIRVTSLDDCGRITPTSESVVSSGFVSISLSPEVEDGQEITLRDADGALAVNEQGNPSFKNLGVEIELSKVNPSLISIMTNAREYEDDSGDVIGFAVPEGEITGRFALELWTGISGVGCGDEGEPSGYMLLPLVMAGTLGDFEVDGENAITTTISNATTKGGNAWGKGPFDVVYDDEGSPSALPEAVDVKDHLLLLSTELAPPPAADSPVEVDAG